MSRRDDVDTESAAIGSSVRGEKSVDSDVPCQDDNEKRTLPGNRYIIAAADGLGSASLSHVGSDTVTHAVVGYLEEAIVGTDSLSEDMLLPLLREAFVHARNRLYQKAKSLDKPVSALNTTLLVAVGGPAGVGGAAVGDGGVVCHRGGQTALVIPRESTEYENKTIPLQSDDWKDSYRSGWVPNVDAAAVFSDGLDGVAWGGPASVSNELFDQVFNSVRDYSDVDELERFLQEFLDGESLRKSSRDDKTLVIGALPARAWTDPAVAEPLDNPFKAPAEMTSPESGGTADWRQEVVENEQQRVQPAGREQRHQPASGSAKRSRVNEQLNKDDAKRPLATAGIVALVVVFAIAAVLWFGVLSGGDATDPSPDLSVDFLSDEVERGSPVSVEINLSETFDGFDEDELDNIDLSYSLQYGSGVVDHIKAKTINLSQSNESVESMTAIIPNSLSVRSSERVTQRVEVEANGFNGTYNDTADLRLSHSIQAAVDGADEGDTIELFPGTYEESVNADVEGLNIVSLSYSEDSGVTIEPPTGEVALRTTASNVRIEGLKLVGAGGADVVSHEHPGSLQIVGSTLEVAGSSTTVHAVDTGRQSGPVVISDSTIEGPTQVESPRPLGINISSSGSESGQINNVEFSGTLKYDVQILTPEEDGSNYETSQNSYTDTDEPYELTLPSFDVEIATEDEVTVGDTLEYTAENTGDIEATRDITLTVDGAEVNTNTGLTLGGGESETETFDYSVSSENESIDVAVESASDSTEKTLTVNQPASFVPNITDITEEVTKGTEITVDYTVENTGDIEGEKLIEVSVGGDVKSNSTFSLDAGETVHNTTIFATELGNESDVNVNISTPDESANETVTITEEDLSAVVINEFDEEVTAGNSLTVNYNITNTRDTEVEQIIKFQIGGETQKDAVRNIPDGDTVSGTFDYQTGLNDTSEITVSVATENDMANRTVRVNQPASFNVTLTSISETATPGTDLLISYEVENIGDVEGTQQVMFAINGTSEQTQSVTLAGGNKDTKEFNYEVGADRTANLSVELESKDDSDSQVVTVETEQSGQGNQQGESMDGSGNSQEEQQDGY